MFAGETAIRMPNQFFYGCRVIATVILRLSMVWFFIDLTTDLYHQNNFLRCKIPGDTDFLQAAERLIDFQDRKEFAIEMKRVNRFALSAFFGIIIFIGCEEPFSFSAYDAAVDEKYRNTTEKNLARIASQSAGEIGGFRIALLSDTHYHFDDLRDAIKLINTRNELAFVVVTGDIAESGLLKEFEFFHHVMSALNKPYVTVIGNHDYLSNGSRIYKDMFGANNYSFVYNNVKFVMFDNVTMESNRAMDLDWLKAEIENAQGFDHVIPFSHIYIWDKQFASSRDQYHRILNENNITLSVNGHKHDYEYTNSLGDDVYFLTIPSPDKRSYVELFISPSGIQVNKIDY